MTRTEIGGTSVSSGIGIGRVFILKQRILAINKSKITKSQVDIELKILEKAIDNVQIEIYDLKDSFKESLSEQDNSIFEAYKLILSDKSFIQEMKDLIIFHLYHADDAVETCINVYIQSLMDSNNRYMAERVHDLRDIKYRIIRSIHGEDTEELNKIIRKQIVFVKQLNPSLAANLAKKKVMGVVAEEGAAYLSHAAIILRGLGIPALNNVKFSDITKFNDMNAIIDGERGIVVVSPTKLEIENYKLEYKAGLKKYRQILREFLRKRKKCAITIDGYRIDVTANIGDLQELDAITDNDIDGIGLVRTELLFIKNKKMPDEKEQYNVYSKIVKKMNKKFVVIRTLDIGPDKRFNNADSNTNASIDNLRGISYSLARKEEFIKQIKAIMMTSEIGDVRITFPMVNKVNEVLKARELLRSSYKELVKEEKNVRHIQFGAVIETKSAVKNIREILDVVDFINIGTNDMLEEFMGIDRKDFHSERIKSILPEFLEIVSKVIKEAKKLNKRVSVCGEIASDPIASILLLGLGADELSMSPAKIDRICHMIRKTSMEEAKKLADDVIKLKDISLADKVLTGSD